MLSYNDYQIWDPDMESDEIKLIIQKEGFWVQTASAPQNVFASRLSGSRIGFWVYVLLLRAGHGKYGEHPGNRMLDFGSHV